MNPRSLISLAFGFIFLLACSLPAINLGSLSSDTKTPESQTSAQTTNDKGIGSKTQASPTSAQTTNDKGVGPKTLDATDPDLLKQHTSSVSSYDQDLYEGFDKSGAPYKLSYDVIHMEQIEPKWGYYSHISVIRNGKVDPAKESEGGQLNGKNFSINAGKCGTSPDTAKHTPSGSWFTGMQDIRGKMNRVEDGVVINGVLTDRYEIQQSNLHGWTRAVEFRPSSLYRAREGGYLVSFVYAVLDQYDSGRVFEKDFDPSKPVLITLRHNVTYYAPGTSFIQLPALCAGK